MYNPPAFREARTEVLHGAIREAGLAILVTTGPDGLMASHIPFLLDPSAGEFGTLFGHVARGNPQARALGQALVIFPGPDSYITPSWYPSKQVDGKVVPTWNYVAVHATGMLETFDDPARLLDIVTRLTERFEAGREKPWAVSDAPADYVAGMLKGITGLALPIAKLEGKWKMSQNRAPGDRAGVVAGLAADGRDDIAALIPR